MNLAILILSILILGICMLVAVGYVIDHFIGGGWSDKHAAKPEVSDAEFEWLNGRIPKK